MEELTKGCEECVEKSYNEEDVVKMLQQKHTKKLESSGVKKIMDNNLSPSTIHNYTAMLVDQANISIIQSVVKKTKIRYASKNSIRGSIANLLTIAANHHI